MNEVSEMWSQPWHALQRNLAENLGGNAIGHATATLRAVNALEVVSTLKGVHIESGAVSANSWLRRAQRRAAAPARARQ
jgi:hypothetical protein